MITAAPTALIGGVSVQTSHGRGWSVDELAKRAADKIIYVGDQSHPTVQAQARAFKEEIRRVVGFYLHEAVQQDRATLAARLRQAGYPDLVSLLED